MTTEWLAECRSHKSRILNSFVCCGSAAHLMQSQKNKGSWGHASTKSFHVVTASPPESSPCDVSFILLAASLRPVSGGDDDEESSRFAEDDAQSATRRNLTWANDHPIQWGPRRPMAATKSAPSQWARRSCPSSWWARPCSGKSRFSSSILASAPSKSAV